MATAVNCFLFKDTKIRGSVGHWYASLKVMGIITATLTKQGNTVEQTATKITQEACVAPQELEDLRICCQGYECAASRCSEGWESHPLPHCSPLQ